MPFFNILMKPGALCKMLIVLVLLAGGFHAYAQCDWHLKKDEDGIKVYTSCSENSNFKLIKVECTINARLSQLVAFLLDVTKQHEWVYSNKTSQLIKKVGPNEIIFYSSVNVPWPCTDRDYISHIVINQQSPQAITIDAHTEPDLLPYKDGLVRVRKSSAHWDVTSLSSDVQKIVYTVQFDPGGSIPAWLVNMFVTKGPLQTFQKLRACVSKPENQNLLADFIK